MTTEHNDELEFRVARRSLRARWLRKRGHADKKENKSGGPEESRFGAKGHHGSPDKSVAGRTRDRVNAEWMRRPVRGAAAYIVLAKARRIPRTVRCGNAYLSE